MPDDATTHLSLPFIAAAQAQKHVTHNEALRLLDVLVQLAVLDRDLAAPPGSPHEGDSYVVATGGSGGWSGKDGQIAAWLDGGWTFLQPHAGWLAFALDEAALIFFDGAAWTAFSGLPSELQNLTLLGLGTTADSANPFSAKLNKALWTAKYAAEGGDGDLRYTLNKETTSDVASLLLQTGWSGRAEIGLIGEDDVLIKTSADGTTWVEALRLDGTTGGAVLRAHETDVASAGACDIGAAASLKVNVTGTTTITSLGTAPHQVKLVRFSGALTLTHNATSLILPGGANIATAAGDTMIAISDASGNWRVWPYQRASGKPVTGPAAADITDATAAGRAVLTGSSGATAFTPAVAGTTTAGAGTYSTRTASYSKIGNLVWFTLTMTWSAHTGTGSLKITGLPLTAAVSPVVLNVYSNNYALTASNVMQAYIATGSTDITFQQVPVGGGAVSNIPLDTAATLTVSGVYAV